MIAGNEMFGVNADFGASGSTFGGMYIKLQPVETSAKGYLPDFSLTTLTIGSPVMVIASWGGRDSGGSFALSEIIKQALASPSNSRVYTLNAGFWYGAAGLTSGVFPLYLPIVIRWANNDFSPVLSLREVVFLQNYFQKAALAHL